jgi:transposase
MQKPLDTRTLSPSAQEALRIRAVEAVLSGKTQVEVARLFGVSRTRVNQWMQIVKKQGKQALKAKRRGGQKQPLLKGWQASWVVRKIRDKNPDQLKLSFVLWTRAAVQEIVWNRFQIKLAIRTIGDYLARWGLTPQKPVKRAYQQNNEAVKEWLEKIYPSIQAQAKKEQATIYWEDEMGLRSDHWRGRSYSPKGEKPVVKTTGVRYGCNMISALSNVGKLLFSVFEGSFTVEVFLGFLERMVKQAQGKKLILIMDAHPVHKAKAVSKWLESRKHLLEVFILPGYSPELNPDELLNQDVKATVFKQKRPSSKQDLKALLSKRLSSIQKQPEKIKAYFQAKYVKYAA